VIIAEVDPAPMIRSPSQSPALVRVDLRGTLVDHGHVLHRRAMAGAGQVLGAAQPPPGAQAGGVALVQHLGSGHDQGLVDRLRAHPAIRLIGVGRAQPAGDLLR